jgi:hypothetical protein
MIKQETNPKFALIMIALLMFTIGIAVSNQDSTGNVVTGMVTAEEEESRSTGNSVVALNVKWFFGWKKLYLKYDNGWKGSWNAHNWRPTKEVYTMPDERSEQKLLFDLNTAVGLRSAVGSDPIETGNELIRKHATNKKGEVTTTVTVFNSEENAQQGKNGREFKAKFRKKVTLPEDFTSKSIRDTELAVGYPARPTTEPRTSDTPDSPDTAAQTSAPKPEPTPELPTLKTTYEKEFSLKFWNGFKKQVATTVEHEGTTYPINPDGDTVTINGERRVLDTRENQFKLKDIYAPTDYDHFLEQKYNVEKGKLKGTWRVYDIEDQEDREAVLYLEKKTVVEGKTVTERTFVTVDAISPEKAPLEITGMNGFNTVKLTKATSLTKPAAPLQTTPRSKPAAPDQSPGTPSTAGQEEIDAQEDQDIAAGKEPLVVSKPQQVNTQTPSSHFTYADLKAGQSKLNGKTVIGTAKQKNGDVILIFEDETIERKASNARITETVEMAAAPTTSPVIKKIGLRGKSLGTNDGVNMNLVVEDDGTIRLKGSGFFGWTVSKKNEVALTEQDLHSLAMRGKEEAAVITKLRAESTAKKAEYELELKKKAEATLKTPSAPTHAADTPAAKPAPAAAPKPVAAPAPLDAKKQAEITEINKQIGILQSHNTGLRATVTTELTKLTELQAKRDQEMKESKGKSSSVTPEVILSQKVTVARIQGRIMKVQTDIIELRRQLPAPAQTTLTPKKRTELNARLGEIKIAFDEEKNKKDPNTQSMALLVQEAGSINIRLAQKPKPAPVAPKPAAPKAQPVPTPAPTTLPPPSLIQAGITEHLVVKGDNLVIKGKKWYNFDKKAKVNRKTGEVEIGKTVVNSKTLSALMANPKTRAATTRLLEEQNAVNSEQSRRLSRNLEGNNEEIQQLNEVINTLTKTIKSEEEKATALNAAIAKKRKELSKLPADSKRAKALKKQIDKDQKGVGKEIKKLSRILEAYTTEQKKLRAENLALYEQKTRADTKKAEAEAALETTAAAEAQVRAKAASTPAADAPAAKPAPKQTQQKDEQKAKAPRMIKSADLLPQENKDPIILDTLDKKKISRMVGEIKSGDPTIDEVEINGQDGSRIDKTDENNYNYYNSKGNLESKTKNGVTTTYTYKGIEDGKGNKDNAHTITRTVNKGRGNEYTVKITNDEKKGKVEITKNKKTLKMDYKTFDSLETGITNEQMASIVSALIKTGTSSLTIEELAKIRNNEVVKGVKYNFKPDGIKNAVSIFRPGKTNELTVYQPDGTRLEITGSDVTNGETGNLETDVDSANFRIKGYYGKNKHNDEADDLTYSLHFETDSKGIGAKIEPKDSFAVRTKWYKDEKGNYRAITEIGVKNKGRVIDYYHPIKEVYNGVYQIDGIHYNADGNKIEEHEGSWKKSDKGSQLDETNKEKVKAAIELLEKDNDLKGLGEGWTARKISDILTTASQIDGYSGIRTLYDEPDWLFYDETVMNVLGGTDGWAAEICKADVIDDIGTDDGFAFSSTTSGAYAYVQGEVITIINYTNTSENKKYYYYKLTLVVNAGSKITGCEIDFTAKMDSEPMVYVEKDGEWSSEEQKWNLEKGDSEYYAGSSMIIRTAQKKYSKACINFDRISEESCLLGIEEGDSLCSTIVDGGEREYTDFDCSNCNGLANIFSLGGISS